MALRDSPLARLLPYHAQYKVPFWLGLGGLLVARIFEAAIPMLLKQGIDAIAAASDAVAAGTVEVVDARSALVLPVALIIVCVSLRFVFITGSRIAIRRIGQQVARDLRDRIYRHLQKQDASFFSRYPTGNLMSRAISDISLVRQFIAGALRTIVVMFLTAVVGLGFMFWLSPWLTLWALAPVPVMAIIAYRLSRQVYLRSHAVQEQMAELNTFVQENLNGIRTVQAAAQEDEEVARFYAHNDEYAQRFLRLMRLNSQINAWMPSMSLICNIIIIAIGGVMVQDGSMTIGTFTAFILYLNMVLWPVRQAGSMVTMWQRGASGAERLYEILDAEPQIRDEESAQQQPDIRGHLEVKDLTWRYWDGASPVLQNVSFEIPEGRMFAVLGKVGAGKSTLLKQFVRLLEPPRGAVFIDGVDIRDYPLAQLRSQVSLVLQDPLLFADRLHTNISYDLPERDEETVWDAATVADLRETVERFPEAMDTVVGERGITLSGGQKQRTTLARGLIQQTPVLILDDVFSSVDTETEEKILTGLRRLRTGKTTLLVSHRVSTARHADHILFLDEGRIIESGSHNELLARGGAYAELERKQHQRDDLLHAIEENEAAFDSEVER